MRRLVQFLGALSLLGLLVGGAALLLAGTWLRSYDEPIKADAIVVLGGSYSRPFYAADLHRQGYAPLIYLSRVYRTRGQKLLDATGVPLPREEELNRQVLLKLGVPEQAIRFFGDGSTSTLEEARALARTVGPGIQRLLIVTSAFHGLRSRIIFSHELPFRELRVLATPYDPYPRLWWTDKDAAVATVLEVLKLSYHLLGGRGLSLGENATVGQ